MDVSDKFDQTADCFTHFDANADIEGLKGCEGITNNSVLDPNTIQGCMRCFRESTASTMHGRLNECGADMKQNNNIYLLYIFFKYF